MGDPVPASERYEHGELDPLSLLALVAAADVVVGAVGWIVPACLATKTPCVVIGGGRGACDAPECLLHRQVESQHIRWILPDDYCRCLKRTHDGCNKTIAYFPETSDSGLGHRPAIVAVA